MAGTSGHGIDEQNQAGETPLHLACFKGNLTAVQVLIELGASLSIKSAKYEIVIAFPFFKRMLMVAQELLDVPSLCCSSRTFESRSGESSNRSPDERRLFLTSLDIASDQFLVEKNVNPLVKGLQGTAADVAQQVHETAVTAYLEGT